MDAGLAVMGMGQPQHTDGDPRAEPTHIKHEELGLGGVYLELQRSSRSISTNPPARGRSFVAVNMIGAGNTALAGLVSPPMLLGRSAASCRGFSCAAHALYTMKKGHAWAASKREPMVQMLDLSMIKYVGPPDKEVRARQRDRNYARKQKRKESIRNGLFRRSETAVRLQESRERNSRPDTARQPFRWVSEVAL